MRYESFYRFAVASGNLAAWWPIRMNSVYDPDYAFGGHNPYGY